MTFSTQSRAAGRPADPPEPAPEAERVALRGLTRSEIGELIAAGGFPSYRAAQLHQWVFRHGAAEFDEMSNLPRELRRWLEERSIVGSLNLVEAGGQENKTRKVLFELQDGRFIESVLMRDEGKGRTSLCLSSQVGCAVGCTFCLTGYGGFQRHLAPEEIASQVIEVRRSLLLTGEKLRSLVFMGMGEPMLNLDAVVKTIRILSDPEGAAISPRRMTVSTSGVIPGIDAFGRAATGANLAVSLNATTDPTRTSIMPLNSRWPITDLLNACRRFPMKARRRITFEYVLMKGINDSPEDARRLVKLLGSIRCKINLIMFNPHELLGFEPVGEATLDLFTGVLSGAHFTVTVRWSKGREIEAACGQLAAHYFRRGAEDNPNN